ncbi:MAG: tannase/feruloyl esterase family alpha/beta hydrolase [Pseudomonadota bacterium]
MQNPILFFEEGRQPARPTIACVALLALTVALEGCGGSHDDNPPGASLATVTVADKCAALQGNVLGKNEATVAGARIAPATAVQPEYCVVDAKMNDSDLAFQASLPTSGWNSKMVYLGGGGFDGAIATQIPSSSESITTERYATVGTNGGYTYPGPVNAGWFQASFASDAVKLADFTYASEHRSLPLAKEIIQKFYGQLPSKSYFEGCSMGGHDALMESQRYPNDFDGIVARAPAGNIMGLFLQFNRIAKLVQTPGGNFSSAKQTLLAKAVLQQCDGLDGASDGIISNPAACHFDPAPLRCSNGADTGDTCLSDAQIAVTKAVTSPVSTADNAWSHTGYNWGQENQAKGWGEYIFPVLSEPFNGKSVQGAFSEGFIRSFITRNPAFDAMTWNADQWLPEMGIIGSMFDANDPDLSRFAARGAKLVLWNGTNDTSVSARETARYYDRVVTSLGQDGADKTVEFFQAPGVGHCYGGAGPDKVDLLKAVSTWVERGVAPSKQNLVHAKVDGAGKTAMTRPVCKYPAYPRYKGSGDMNNADSFSCSTQ